MKPMTHEIMAAGPATEDASQAPKSQPEPINEPKPVSYTHLTLPTILLV